MEVIVLGSGRVGSAMARDLAADEQITVTVADSSQAALERLRDKAAVNAVVVDLSDPKKVGALAADHDLVINAMPGFLGYQTLEAALMAGRNVVDISFFSEDPFSLDELAKQQGVVAIVDIGVCPGMSGLLVGHIAQTLDAVEDVAVYVGGLPVERTKPWEYKAVFSPIDVIEEYVRPARLKSKGQVVTRPALTEIELIDLPGIGTLEAFNTDGLRTLLDTVPAENMVEKTLRYPGHAEKMRTLRDLGLFDKEPVDVEGKLIRPLDLTTTLLFPAWQLEEGEADVTVMRVEVVGRQDGQRIRHAYDLLDHYDAENGVTSMARTTGYTATTAARLIHEMRYDRPGISPPEFLGADPSCVSYMLAGLSEHGVDYSETISRVD